MNIRIEGADIIREHIKRKISHLLGTVECSENPRDKCDWYAACKILEKLPHLVPIAVRALVRNTYSEQDNADVIDIPGDYEAFDRICGRVIWENIKDMRGSAYLPRPPYGRIIFG